MLVQLIKMHHRGWIRKGKPSVKEDVVGKGGKGCVITATPAWTEGPVDDPWKQCQE